MSSNHRLGGRVWTTALQYVANTFADSISNRRSDQAEIACGSLAGTVPELGPAERGEMLLL